MNKAVIIGGSAGSFQVVVRILNSLPKTINYPVFLCLHRLKHVKEGFVEALSIKSNIPVVEPFDKDPIKAGIAYLAPSNYHMYIDSELKIALSTEDAVNHSRPAIDLSFVSCAYTFKQNLTGIILSGANKDGAMGLKSVHEQGGITIAQSLDECQIKTMPDAAIKATTVKFIYTTDQIIDYLCKLK